MNALAVILQLVKVDEGREFNAKNLTEKAWNNFVFVVLTTGIAELERNPTMQLKYVKAYGLERGKR